MTLGNDIVALDQRSERSGQPVFYSKILTGAEKQLYSREQFPFVSFEHYVWLCWAVKEAAFKCVNRLEPGTLYWGPRITITDLSELATPPGESCLDIGSSAGPLQGYAILARFNDYRFQAWAIAGADYILAVCIPGETFSIDSFRDIHWGIRRLDSADAAVQSAGVREFLLEKLHRWAPGQRFSFGKTLAGHPFIIGDERPLDMGLSLSHHQDWVAYAFATEPACNISLPGPDLG